MLPFGWTAEALLGSHSSKPYKPDIARVFYRAGYIESLGRGIQKIQDACKNLETDAPEYMVHREDIMLKEYPRLTQKEMVMLSTSRATVQRLMKELENSQLIERKDGKRYGYWEVKELLYISLILPVLALLPFCA